MAYYIMENNCPERSVMSTIFSLFPFFQNKKQKVNQLTLTFVSWRLFPLPNEAVGSWHWIWFVRSTKGDPGNNQVKKFAERENTCSFSKMFSLGIADWIAFFWCRRRYFNKKNYLIIENYHSNVTLRSDPNNVKILLNKNSAVDKIATPFKQLIISPPQKWKEAWL